MPEKISLKAARVNMELSRKSAADAIGVSVATLKNWESGKTSPGVDKVDKICDVYQIAYDCLFFGKRS